MEDKIGLSYVNIEVASMKERAANDLQNPRVIFTIHVVSFHNYSRITFLLKKPQVITNLSTFIFNMSGIFGNSTHS